MNQEEPYIDGEDREQMIAKCEAMLNTKKSVYFDVFEFESIIDFYIEDNKLSKAMYIIDVALQQHPQSAELEVKKAKLLIERNRSHEALELINKLLKVDESNTDLLLMKGSCLVEQSKLEEAALVFEFVIENTYHSEREEMHYACSLAYIDNGLYKESIPHLLAAHRFDPENTLILYDLAYSYDRIIEFEESIKYYKMYLDIDPYSDNAWYNLGIVYNKDQKYSEAIDAFDYAIAINDNYASAYFNKANTLANWERFQMAISVYNEYLELEPQTALALYYIGECYEKLNEYEMAIEYYNDVLKIDRKYSDAWFGIGIIKYYQDQLEEAKSYMEHALELDSQNCEYWLSYGNVVRAMDTMPKETLNAYKKATQLNPYDAECWMYYADALKQYATADLAIEVLKKAMTYIKDDPEILFTLAAYFYDNNQLDVAMKKYLMAVNIDVSRASVFFNNCSLTEEDKEMFIELIKNNK